MGGPDPLPSPPGPGLAEAAGAGVVGWPSHEARSGLAWEHRLQLKGRAAGPAVQRRQVKGAAVRTCKQCLKMFDYETTLSNIKHRYTFDLMFPRHNLDR